MGVLSTVSNIFKGKNKAYQALYSWGIKFTQYDSNLKNYVENGYNVNSDVYAVVSQQASEINRIPYFIKPIKDELEKEKYDQLRLTTKNVLSFGSFVKTIQQKAKAFEQEEYPMPIDRPNPMQTWRELFSLYKTYMALTGNFYLYLRSPEDGMNQGVPTEIYVLPAHLIEIVLKEGIDMLSSDSPIDYYILNEGNQFIRFEEANIIHIKYPNPNFDLKGSHLYGQSPLRAALKDIQASNEAKTLNAKTLANGGSFGFISTKEPLNEQQAKGLKDRLIEMDNSPKRLSNIAGSSHEVVFTRISLTTEELKPFDYLEYDQKAICNVLHWDDKLLNSDDGAKYDNYKLALRRAITGGISPDLRLLEEAFNSKFLPRFPKYKNRVIVFDETQLPEMQEDMEKLTKWLNDTLDRGVISRDEYREAINYAATENPLMEVHTVAMNVISLEDALTPSDDLTFNVDE